MGAFSCALMAGPPSPEYPCVPLPAMVKIGPPTTNRRTSELESVMYTAPE